MTIHDLKYFEQVCRYGSFSKAAVALYLSQQALSRSIKGLESELKHPLFFRNSNGVTLTPFGSDFYKQMKKVLADFKELECYGERYRAESNQSLTIGMRDQGMVPYMVLRLAEKYKKERSDVEFNYISMKQDVLLRRLILEEIDLGVIPCIDCENDLDQQYYETVLLSRRQIKMCINAENPLASKENITWADLKNEKFFLPGAEKVITRAIMNRCQKYGFVPETEISTSDMFVPYLIVQDNKAIAFMPDFLLEDEQKSNGLTKVREVKPALYMDYLLVMKRNPRKNKILTDFIEYTQRHISEQFNINLSICL